MRALRKINNNAVICLDSTGQEMIAMGKGLGFGPMPREISLAEVERTFYNIDERYVAVMRDLPADVLDFSARIIDIARNELPYTLSPNAFLTLADHLAFTLERARKHIRVKMPLAYDVEQLYPAEYRIGRYALKRIQKEFRVGLPQTEAVGIAINLINARADGEQEPEQASSACTDSEMLEEITEIVENHFNLIVDRSSFNYARYATHMQYLFGRLHSQKAISSGNQQMYASLRQEFPEAAACAEKIAALIRSRWDCALPEEEEIYLILHINRICIKEGL